MSNIRALRGVTPKELRVALTLLKHEGWRIERTSKNHFKCYPPNSNNYLLSPGTGSDRRSLENFKAEARRVRLLAERKQHGIA
ncbi:MAG: hypothetical protein E6R03_11650 [Hyphomicrobiaceae bacterium]|nr:MAG: hypothetical protein E6R03_11650 [Hyphomicrobiaceae bacterium]